MIVCWLKGAAFVFALIGTVCGLAAVVLGILLAIIWIGERIDDRWPEGSLSKKIFSRLTAYALITVIFGLLIAGVIGAKKKVCREGFVTAYKQFLGSGFGR